jgi:hypothetical protein
MANLSFTEKMRLEKLLGMRTGYVLDFSNRTFQEFILDSTNKDIYDDAFNAVSGSKAHRLRMFWSAQPDSQVGKLVLDLCDYYRATKGSDSEAELVRECIAVGHRLCGKAGESQIKSTTAAADLGRAESTPRAQTAALARRENEPRLLLAAFEEMAKSTDHQRRGYLLQDLLHRLFVLNEIPVKQSFQRNEGGEQIDGAFRFEGWFYIVECRWREKLANIRELDGLLGQVGRSGVQTLGLYLSVEGWSSNVPNLLKQNQHKRLILMEGFDLRCVLDGHISLPDLLSAKLEHFNLKGEPYLGAFELLQQRQN